MLSNETLLQSVIIEIIKLVNIYHDDQKRWWHHVRVFVCVSREWNEESVSSLNSSANHSRVQSHIINRVSSQQPSLPHFLFLLQLPQDLFLLSFLLTQVKSTRTARPLKSSRLRTWGSCSWLKLFKGRALRLVPSLYSTFPHFNTFKFLFPHYQTKTQV